MLYNCIVTLVFWEYKLYDLSVSWNMRMFVHNYEMIRKIINNQFFPTKKNSQEQKCSKCSETCNKVKT